MKYLLQENGGVKEQRTIRKLELCVKRTAILSVCFHLLDKVTGVRRVSEMRVSDQPACDDRCDRCKENCCEDKPSLYSWF